MMKTHTALSAVLALMVASPLAAAPEFNVDSEPVGENGTRLWISYLADNNVTALDFTVHLSSSADIRGNARDCLASLPKSHRGLCKLEGGKLRGVIFSPTNTPLSDTNVGSVLLDPDSMLKQGGEKADLGISSVEVTTVNAQGVTVRADVRISGQLAQTSGKQGD